MKFSILVGAVAGVAICATAATAQVCQGDLPYRARSTTHVGGTIGMTDHTTSFGGGLSVGHAQGWFGGASAGMLSYDNNGGHSAVVGGGLGYSMPLQQRSKWQVCPGATLALGFGPSIDTGAGTEKISSQILTLGASIGTSMSLSKSTNLLPFFSAALGHTRVAFNGASASDNYLLLGGGAGFQLTPSLVLRPAFSIASGSESADDTAFSFGVTWALPR